MKPSALTFIEKGKHALYLFSIGLLLFLCALVFLHAAVNFTHMDFLASILSKWELVLLVLALAAVLLAAILFLHRRICRLSDRRQRLILLLAAGAAIAVQYGILFTFQATLRYDHLKVFDEALEIFRTGEISMTYGENYFAQYPFNIPITLFNYFVLCAAKQLAIPESFYMLTIQCVYLAGTDLAVFLSYRILRMLRSARTASLFLLICLVNPLLYMYGFACYTTILMLPFLMLNLFLFIVTVRETRRKQKILFAFLLGIAFILGTKIRANLLITLITFAGYLILRVLDSSASAEKNRQMRSLFLTSCLAALIGGVLCYSTCMSLEHKYVKGDYSDTQLPASYYFLFSSKLDSLGSYNEEDHVFIQQFETEKEKNTAAWNALFKRLAENGLSGNLFLADYKLSFTWSDGIDDYPEFLHTTTHYGTLYSFLAGSRKDLFALACHVYHVMTLAALVWSVFLSLRRKCDTPFYCIFLNLLGAMLFHLIWEAGWAYSISFTLLVLILSADGLSDFSKRLDHSRLPVYGMPAAFCAVVGIVLFHGSELFTVPFKQMEYAVVQDMSEGEDLKPLLSGEVITQTFTTDHSFNHIGCKVLNSTGESNSGTYRIELLDSEGNVLGSRDLSGGEVLNKDYCYVKFDSVIPNGLETYTIRVTALEAEGDNSLTFLYYNSGNWNIYREGEMSGLNSDEKTDLTFVVYDSVTKCFFNR